MGRGERKTSNAKNHKVDRKSNVEQKGRFDKRQGGDRDEKENKAGQEGIEVGEPESRGKNRTFYG